MDAAHETSECRATYPAAATLGYAHPMSLDAPHPVPRFLLERAAAAPDATLCVVPDTMHAALPGGRPHPEQPGWWSVSVSEAAEQVAGLTLTLRELGVGTGDRVAVVAETSHLWAAVDLAVLSVGAVTVGLYPTLPAAGLARQLDHCGATLVVFQDAALAARFTEVLSARPRLVVRVLYPGGPHPALQAGRAPLSELARAIDAIDPQQPATIVYTSGTTGHSKGAVLTHAAFHHVVRHSRDAFPTRPGDRSVVFLPMAHVLQRFATYRGLVDGVEGWYTPSLAALPETIRVARPHVLVAVPRVLEKIQARARAQAEARGALSLFEWATSVGQAPVTRSWRARARRQVADRLVLRRIRRGLGGHLRAIVSGGAALDPRLAAWFEGAGIAVREGWGLTETCAPATATPLDAPRPGSVGLPLAGVQVRSAPDGELQVASPALFTRYLDDPGATAAAFTPDGWFRTGDLGRVDPDGYVWITGRAKDLIITSGGRNIAPRPAQEALHVPGVGHVVLIGDDRPHLVALCFPDAEDPGPAPTAALTEAVDRWNRSQPRHSQVVRWRWVPEPLTIEAGTLTPTLKVKRREVALRHAGLVDALYAG